MFVSIKSAFVFGLRAEVDCFAFVVARISFTYSIIEPMRLLLSFFSSVFFFDKGRTSTRSAKALHEAETCAVCFIVEHQRSAVQFFVVVHACLFFFLLSVKRFWLCSILGALACVPLSCLHFA